MGEALAGGGSGVSDFFTTNPNLKFFFWREGVGGGGEGGARVSDFFFTKNPNQKKTLEGGAGGGGVGLGELE